MVTPEKKKRICVAVAAAYVQTVNEQNQNMNEQNSTPSLRLPCRVLHANLNSHYTMPMRRPYDQKRPLPLTRQYII